jgi:hypothetical protein
MLDHQKETGKSLTDASYAGIFNNCKEWIKEYVNPVLDDPFVEDVSMFKPHLATLKNSDAIKG